MWRIFFKGEELFGAHSFHVTIPTDKRPARVSVSFPDPKMPGARIRYDYSLDRIEEGYHLYLMPFAEGLSYDLHRMLKGDFKIGK